MTAHTWTELDLAALAENITSVRGALSRNAEMIFVVKANAYGHGMEPVARCAWSRGVRWFAVAHIDEAVALRGILPDAEILMVSVLDARDVPSALEARITPIVVSTAHARELAQAASQVGHRLTCHVKIDSGMGRLGFPWRDASEQIPHLASLTGLDITGACTHFATSDHEDRTFMLQQSARFQKVVDTCAAHGLALPFLHVANSGAMLREGSLDLAGVRPGIVLYGYEQGDSSRGIATRPFLQWKTRVLQVKDVPAGYTISYGSTYVTPEPTRIATIDVGYADGYARRLSNKGMVLIDGRRCPIAGRVTMSLMTVDAGADADVAPGDEVVLLGSQGAESIWADEIASWCDTISYEILTSLKPAKRYVLNGESGKGQGARGEGTPHE